MSADVAIAGSAVRVGLVSDTHMPARWRSLPERIFTVLEGVDLLLHAGDVGELWVLDELSRIAPVVAVHGNDETAEAQTALPYSTVIVESRTRILLCHSHQRDPAAELASRAGDDWEPKLAVRAVQAKDCGAGIYVFGHMHVPLVRYCNDVLLINPGAIAAGNQFCRQLVQSAAVLTIVAGVEPRVEHFRLDQPVPVPSVSWDAGFATALSVVSSPIVTPEVRTAWAELRKLPQHRDTFNERLQPLAHRRWAGDPTLISADELVNVAVERALDAEFCRALHEALSAPPSSHPVSTE